MTMPSRTARGLCDVARQLGCVGIELRNDLDQPLFDGVPGADVAAYAASIGQEILALAEVGDFNAAPADQVDRVEALANLAQSCGAEAIVLIPHVGTAPMDRATQREILRAALTILQPILKERGVIGLIEPLGFANSSLRHKQDVVAVLDDIQRPHCFGMIHDTFHHALAGGGPVYADLTRVVHISGVADPVIDFDAMTDAHRGLIDAHDRLDSIDQLRALQNAGYTGPASFEVFAPDIHSIKDPATAVARSIAFITAQMAQAVPECA